MIKVKVILENDKYKTITMNGHANADVYGKDIVCAAASSILTTSVNACLSFDKNCLDYEAKSGNVKINVLSNDNVTQTLIANMVNLLKELETNYPKNIEIK